MRDRPNARDLLEIAREVLQQKLLPRLPDAARYDALMVANALANAERELAAGEAPLLAERERLAAIYGEPAEPAAGPALEAALDRLNRRLVADIRAGRFDGDAAVQRHLLAVAVDAVRESNPKYLAGRKLE